MKKLISKVCTGVCILSVLVMFGGCTSDSKEDSGGAKTEEAVETGVEAASSVKDSVEGGIKYRVEKYKGITMKYPVNELNIVSKEKICSKNNCTNMAGMNGNNGYFPMYIQVKLPVLFEDENITSITYTLQNSTGSFWEGNEGFKGLRYFGGGGVFESVPIEWKPNETDIAQFSVIREFTGIKSPKATVQVQAFKDAVNAAIIKADISYNNGTKETEYVGIEITGDYNIYNISTLDFYKLNMQ